MPQRDLHEYISASAERTEVRAGHPLPWGTHQQAGGVNFSLFSRNASSVRLELFDRAEHAHPSRVIDMNTPRHRTGDVWHVWVAGLRSGQFYAYRIDGPYQPTQGYRFNVNRLLLDPFATAVSSAPPWNFTAARGYDTDAAAQDLARSANDNAMSMPKCIVLNESFDWGDDQPPRHPWSSMIIYEAHVRGFTVHPLSRVDHPQDAADPDTATRLLQGVLAEAEPFGAFSVAAARARIDLARLALNQHRFGDALKEAERAAAALRQVRSLHDVRLEDELTLIRSEALAALDRLDEAQAGAAAALAAALRHDGPHSPDLRRAQALVRRLQI